MNIHPITPSILAYSAKELRDKVLRAQHMKAKTIHIDVIDGKFVPYSCYCTPARVKTALDVAKKFGKLPVIEIHLMTRHPENQIEKWKAVGAKRIIFHWEATDNPIAVIRAIKSAKMEAWVAINPGTKTDRLSLIFSSISGIVVMGVMPGRGGQRFRPSVLKNIEYIRKNAPNLPIAVDGGVRDTNAEKIIKAGATRLISGSMIFNL